MTLMLCGSDKANEIRKYLERELGISPQCKWFEVRFAVDELVTVKCEFCPQAPDELTGK